MVCFRGSGPAWGQLWVRPSGHRKQTWGLVGVCILLGWVWSGLDYFINKQRINDIDLIIASPLYHPRGFTQLIVGGGDIVAGVILKIILDK